jgi:hypothetical protein
MPLAVSPRFMAFGPLTWIELGVINKEDLFSSVPASVLLSTIAL